MNSRAAATPDGSVFVRVAEAGHVVGVQLESAVMRRPGHEIAERIMACADAAYLAGQVALRDRIAAGHATPDCYDWMPVPGDVEAAVARLGQL